MVVTLLSATARRRTERPGPPAASQGDNDKLVAALSEHSIDVNNPDSKGADAIGPPGIIRPLLPGPAALAVPPPPRSAA